MGSRCEAAVLRPLPQRSAVVVVGYEKEKRCCHWLVKSEVLLSPKLCNKLDELASRNCF